MNKGSELIPEQPEGIGIIRSEICLYCRNRLRHGCITACAPEGLYRNLEPTELDLWHFPPKMPGMAKLLDYAPVSRLALMYLVLAYMQADQRG